MEMITMISALKEFTTDPALIATLVGIYFRLESQAKMRDQAMVKKNDERWDLLIKTLDVHSQKNEERFTKIENHIGLKK